MASNKKPTAEAEKAKDPAELSETQLKDVSGGPIYMDTNTLLPAVQVNPTMSVGTFTGGLKGG